MNDSKDNDRLLTISQAAELLNVSKVTLRRWTNAGRLPCLRVGPRQERRFRESAIRSYLAQGDAPATLEPPPEAPRGAHRCVVCRDPDEEKRLLARLVEQHLAAGAQVVIVADTKRAAALNQLLARRGLDPAALESSTTLRRFSVAESYLASGTFSVERSIAFLESVVLAALARGFDRVLFVGYVDWIDDGEPADREALLAAVMSYENRLNALAQRYPALTILCPYVLSCVDASTIVDAFCAHPELQFESHVAAGLFPRHGTSELAGTPGI